MMFCWASFDFGIEMADIASEFPGFLDWEVTKEHFTKEELSQ